MRDRALIGTDPVVPPLPLFLGVEGSSVSLGKTVRFWWNNLRAVLDACLRPTVIQKEEWLAEATAAVACAGAGLAPEAGFGLRAKVRRMPRITT